MKSKQIKQELEQLEFDLVDVITEIGVKKSVEISGLKQPDISAWKNGRRKWTWNKILAIAEKLGL